MCRGEQPGEKGLLEVGFVDSDFDEDNDDGNADDAYDNNVGDGLDNGFIHLKVNRVDTWVASAKDEDDSRSSLTTAFKRDHHCAFCHHHHHHHLNDGLPMEVEPTGFNPRILLSGPQIAGAVVIIIVVMIYDNNPQPSQV